jgi:hypothetical protein
MSFLINLSISLFAVFVITCDPAPGFTEPATSNVSPRLRVNSVAHPLAWLSPMTIPLFFFPYQCHFFFIIYYIFVLNFVLSSLVLWGYSATHNDLHLVVSVVNVWLLVFWIFYDGL